MGKVELTDFEREYSYLRYGGSATEFMLDNPKAVQMIKEEARVVLELAEKEVKRLDSLKKDTPSLTQVNSTPSQTEGGRKKNLLAT